MSAICNTCNEPVLDDREKPLAERDPCPKCGSREKLGVVTSTATFAIETQDYVGSLLDLAHRMAQESQFGVATTVCHVACEVIAEKAFFRGFAQNNIAHLKEPILEFMNGFSLANERIRKLYTALTGDAIEKQPFWDEFTRSAKRRNRCTHRENPITHEEAQRSVETAYAFVHHVRPFAGQ